jgi:hypothetical protein
MRHLNEGESRQTKNLRLSDAARRPVVLRVPVQTKRPERSTNWAGFRLKPVSFVLSAAFHGAVVAIMALAPTREESAEDRIYEEVIRPQERKLIWYDFRKKLPDVTPPVSLGNAPHPRGIVISKEAIVAASPKPKSSRQFIWQPVPKIEIRRDLPLPNFIARANTALPPPPEFKKPPPREFKRPPARPNADAVRPVREDIAPPELKGDLNHALQNPNDGIPLKLGKAFVPPPAVARPARLSTPALITETPMPDPSVAGSPRMKSSLPEGFGSPAISAGAPPPSAAPAGTVASAGNGSADLAVVGLHPAENFTGSLPDGSRPGRFSKAPASGEAATGNGPGSLSVPDLSVRGDRKKSLQPPGRDATRNAILYADRVRSIPTSTLSVPLRPAARMIPRAIDARFQGRPVYTMVVPIENLPAYGGDWILWFAEHDQRPGDNPVMRPPVPFRKLEPVEAAAAGNRVEQRVQFAAVIKKDGHLDAISLLRNLAPAIQQTVAQDLACWEFRPATRDGTAIDIDVVIEIPFNLSPEIARQTEP